MKKKSLINLIKYHVRGDDFAFKEEAREVAQQFDSDGDYELARYIISLISEAGSLIGQTTKPNLYFLESLTEGIDSLPLPDCIADDIRGLVNAINKNLGINKFLFQGPPGTGKTESAKQVSRLLGRNLYRVNFNTIIDSKLGQTGKNIAALFEEIDNITSFGNAVILFDEVDALVLDRSDSNDVREMGRATSALLSQIDEINPSVVLIATTNLFKELDKAIVRRFDFVVDFSRYSQSDLAEIAELILKKLMKSMEVNTKDIRLFRKILAQADHLPYPAELTNIIKSSIAFSDPDDPAGYLKRIYRSLVPFVKLDIAELKRNGFSLREIELLTGVSKSTVSRELKVLENEQYSFNTKRRLWPLFTQCRGNNFNPQI